MLPDVNVLVAAHRADHPHHAVASQWLQATLKTDQMLSLPMPVVSGFLRLSTHPKVFIQPSPIAKAIDFMDWLLEDKNVRLIETSAEWKHFRQLALDRQLQGNDLPDAWLASLSLSLSAPFVTFDKGFRRLLPRSLLVLLAGA